MDKLTREDLMTLEEYAKKRPEFRANVLQHKKPRKLLLGEHAALYFEDRLTMQYQIQEMLRVERIFEEQGIMDELNAYNPLIPDGSNLKATFMIEYSDPDVRKRELEKMIGIEDKVWVKVDGFEKIKSGLKRMALTRCTRLQMKIWTVKTRKRHLPCIFCVSSLILTWYSQPNREKVCQSALTIRHIMLPWNRYPPNRSRRW